MSEMLSLTFILVIIANVIIAIKHNAENFKIKIILIPIISPMLHKICEHPINFL